MRKAILVLTALTLLTLPASAQHWVENSWIQQWTPSVTLNTAQNEWWASYVDHDGAWGSCGPHNSCSANTTTRAFSHSGSYRRERVLANTFYIPDKDPYLVYNPEKNQFLALWYDNAQGTVFNESCGLRADIKGRILDRWGNAISGVLDISSNYHYDQAFPRGAYNKATNSYMVVWQEVSSDKLCHEGWDILTDGPWRVRGRILNDNGSNRTGLLMLSNQDSNQERPDVVSHPNQDKFMVVWQDRRHGTSHIFGQMFNKWGQKYFPHWELIVGLSSNGNRNSKNPKVTYNAHDDHFLAVWNSSDNGYQDDGVIYANRLRGSDAAWVTSPVVVSDGLPNEHDNEWADVMYCPSSQRYWISWETNEQAKIATFTRNLNLYWHTVLSHWGKAVSIPDDCRSNGQIMAVWEERNLGPYRGTPSIRAQFFY